MSKSKIFKPKKGDKLWLMFHDRPVEATVLETPKYYTRGKGYDGVWELSIPEVEDTVVVWPRRIFATRKECLAFHLQDKREAIAHDRQIIQQDKEYLKRDEELYAKWFKMLENEDG